MGSEMCIRDSARRGPRNVRGRHRAHSALATASRRDAAAQDMGGSSVGAQDGYDLDEDLPMVLHGEGRRLGGRVLKGKHPPGGSGRRAHEDFR